MKVRLIVDLQCGEGIYLTKGTILEVDECKGNWYVCSNKQISCMYISKASVEIVKEVKSTKFTKEEKHYLLDLIKEDGIKMGKLEGAISDDGWIYDMYEMQDSIREKLDNFSEEDESDESNS